MSALVVVAGVALIGAATIAAVVFTVVRRHGETSPERRCRQAILDLSVDRDHRLWAAGSIGVIGGGPKFGCGAGCAGGGCGGGCGG